jgi:hypothetical protein
MHSSDTNAVCRGCGLVLSGKPYWAGGSAYHPRTGDRCPANYYGGYACSEQCDRKASREQESSFPGAGPARTLSSCAERRLRDNWPQG